MWGDVGFMALGMVFLAALVVTVVTAYAVGRLHGGRRRGSRRGDAEVLGATGGVVTTAGEAWLHQLAGSGEAVPWMDQLRKLVREQPAGEVLRIEVLRVGQESDFDA
jgi:hypothetical protein